MPWKESDFMSERIKFIGRLLDGERMSDLCKEFKISRKTGYKIKNRFEKGGIDSLENKPTIPYNIPNKTHESIVKKILDKKKTYKTWGALKIRESLLRQNKLNLYIPSISTIHSILKKNGKVEKRKKEIYIN